MILKSIPSPIQDDPEIWDLPRCLVDADSHEEFGSADQGEDRRVSQRQCRDRVHRAEPGGALCPAASHGDPAAIFLARQEAARRSARTLDPNGARSRSVFCPASRSASWRRQSVKVDWTTANARASGRVWLGQAEVIRLSHGVIRASYGGEIPIRRTRSAKRGSGRSGSIPGNSESNQVISSRSRQAVSHHSKAASASPRPA